MLGRKSSQKGADEAKSDGAETAEVPSSSETSADGSGQRGDHQQNEQRERRHGTILTEIRPSRKGLLGVKLSTGDVKDPWY